MFLTSNRKNGAIFNPNFIINRNSSYDSSINPIESSGSCWASFKILNINKYLLRSIIFYYY